ncbi:hypothetical protein SAMN04515674_10873 [Pseudarcicella hirudinis]|uniref:Uncharacterized protein n=1 Tax=Pseudarcicella hirudinis TaxID=1079859 RepID=A0A1I5UVA3_9BACT|nr:hypothetical protein [Pseudarcicella hirudinis]SFP99129.1 hypothetical protein SAMN04515674_10873 [Pseudarcicella hirudinis]
MFLFSGIKGIMLFQESTFHPGNGIATFSLGKPHQKRIETPNPEFIHNTAGAEIPEKCTNPAFTKNSDSVFFWGNVLKTDYSRAILFAALPTCIHKIYLIINVLRI